MKRNFINDVMNNINILSSEIQELRIIKDNCISDIKEQFLSEKITKLSEIYNQAILTMKLVEQFQKWEENTEINEDVELFTPEYLADMFNKDVYISVLAFIMKKLEDYPSTKYIQDFVTYLRDKYDWKNDDDYVNLYIMEFKSNKNKTIRRMIAKIAAITLSFEAYLDFMTETNSDI